MGGMTYLFPCLSDRGLSQCEGGGGGTSTYMINIMYRVGKPTKLFLTKYMLKLLFTKKGSKVA